VMRYGARAAFLARLVPCVYVDKTRRYGRGSELAYAPRTGSAGKASLDVCYT
jgi:hypothetical protein